MIRDRARIVDLEMERRAGHLAAVIALAENLPIETADKIVIAVFQELGHAVEHVGTSPARETLLAPLRTRQRT